MNVRERRLLEGVLGGSSRSINAMNSPLAPKRGDSGRDKGEGDARFGGEWIRESGVREGGGEGGQSMRECVRDYRAYAIWYVRERDFSDRVTGFRGMHQDV